MARRTKLTYAEVQQVVEKIVKKYDEYSQRFFKAPSLRMAFEERYFSALRSGMDMNAFLQAEIEVIDDLLRKEEERLQKSPNPRRSGPRRDFADRVMDEFRRRISKYKDAAFSRQANLEIRRLVGALHVLDEEHIPQMHEALRETSYNANSREIVDLESRLRDMSSTHHPGGVPPRLTRYVALLQAFPRDYNAIDREEKSFLLEAGYLLNDIREIISRVLETFPHLRGKSRTQLSSVDDYIRQVTEDFRIKDFNRRNFQEGK